MTATDELRRMLDERGVEWDYGIGGASTTEFMTSSGLALSFMDWRDRLTCTTLLTPEQAIAATLGAGTCRFVTVVDQDPSRRHRGNIAECDCCGYRCAIGFIQDERFRYCPNCGAKVVGE